jgi:ankyrin repeat protein
MAGTDLVNARDEYGRKALHFAASRGYLLLISFLLGHTTGGVGVPNNAGYTPLHSAATKGHYDVTYWTSRTC